MMVLRARARFCVAGLSVLLVACRVVRVTGPAVMGPDTAKVPLSALGTKTYLGFAGGLYPDGANEIPADHAANGMAAARLIQPLDGNGNPSATGKYVLLSIGMSNTTQEFCNPTGPALACGAQTFAGQAAADPAVNHSTLVLVDGARSGQTAGTWDNPGDANYNTVRDTRLAPLGLSERQVQAVWLKEANAGPTVSLPGERADAYTLVTQLGDIVRAARTRYPNLRQVFLSSRIFAGYATSTLNPEPYAYETGFAVKWVVAAQIAQDRQGFVVDARAGDLDYPTTSPWLAWGPYLWADGMHARAGDGLYWAATDFQNDGTHPSQSGQQKVGQRLLEFFKTSAYTRCWFLAGQRC